MTIWQADNWPNLTYQQAVFQQRLLTVLDLQHQLIGKAKELPDGLDHQAEMDALTQNALQTSEIEGEPLNVGSVRSSVAKHLGLDLADLNLGKAALGKMLPATQQTESLVVMLCEATAELKTPLSQQVLCDWQSALFPEPPLVRPIAIGELRGEATMRVVSEKAHREIIHFEAPPKNGLEQELKSFLDWLNVESLCLKSKNQNTPLEQTIIRAAVAHFWFLTLHPFDDGNSRVARALTDRALAQAEQTSIRFYSMSAAIEKNRQSYYDILESTQNCNTDHQIKGENSQTDITGWLMWFLDVLSQAMQQGLKRIDRVVAKTQFWQRHSQTVLTERQVKVLNRLLDSADDEFLQGINASQYKSLAKVSKATATRDLSELLIKGCLQQLAGGGRSTQYCIVISC